MNNYLVDPISTTHEFQTFLLRLTISLVTLLNKGFGAFLCLQHSHKALSVVVEACTYGYTLGYTLTVYLKYVYLNRCNYAKTSSPIN